MQDINENRDSNQTGDIDFELLQQINILTPQLHWLARFMDFIFDVADNVKYENKPITQEDFLKRLRLRKLDLKKLTYFNESNGIKIERTYVLEREIAIYQKLYTTLLAEDEASRDLSIMIPLKQYINYLKNLLIKYQSEPIKAFKSNLDKNELKEIYYRLTSNSINDDPPFISSLDDFIGVFSGGMYVLPNKIQWNIYRNKRKEKNKLALTCFLMLMLDKNENAKANLFTRQGMNQVEQIFDTSINKQSKNQWETYSDICFLKKRYLTKQIKFLSFNLWTAYLAHLVFISSLRT